MKVEAIRLTPEMASRKNQVLDFIRAYFATHGSGPSLSEIAEACRTNKARVQDAIRKLEREQRVNRVPGKKGGTTPIGDHAEALRQLAAQGYIINPPMPLLDLDEDGRLTIVEQPRGVTKTSLPMPRARAHDARRQGGAARGEKTDKDGEGRGEGDGIATA